MTILRQLSLLSLISASTLACASPAAYQFQALTSLGGGFSEATSISNSGLIAGRSLTSSGMSHATYWQNGVVHDLGTLGGSNSYARSINDAGQIVGSSETSHGTTSAVLWMNGTATALTAIGGVGANGDARAINNAGIIVGASAVSTAGGASFHATEWKAGFTIDLGTLGGPSSWGNAINDAGIVGGSANTLSAPYAHAALWNGNVVKDLGSTEQFYGAVFGVNEAGTLVGLAEDLPFGGYYAATWNGHVPTRLNGIEAGRPSYAWDINNEGNIVGKTDGLIGDRATLWKGGVAFDLNSFLDTATQNAGWVLLDASSINDSGWIVGKAFNYSTREMSAYLLTPVPEPESWALLSVGLFVLSRRIKSNKRKAG